MVDADRHAFCQAMYKGSEGQEWDVLYHQCRELHQAPGIKNLGDSPKAKVPSTMKAAKDREE